MKKINFLSARSVRETSDRQSSPAFTRDLNTTFNTMMSFGRWAASPLIAAFNAGNASLRMKMPSRLVCSVVLTGICGLALAGCGGGTDSGGGNGGDGRGNPIPGLFRCPNHGQWQYYYRELGQSEPGEYHRVQYDLVQCG